MPLAPLLLAALCAPPALPQFAALTAAPPTVLFDRADDGALWALGTNYKMRFAADGVTYFPLFGERAQQHTPLSFDVAAPITAPIALDGNRVSLTRGGLVEVYDLAPDHVEQSFVLAARPAGGDFSLRVKVATDLPAARGANGLRFDAGDLGHVEYGDATIVDAAGRTIARRSEWDGSGVRFALPASFLAGARFPVTIDPLISTFNVDGSSLACAHPGVAYDREFDFFLVAYERAATGTDHDIIERRYSTLGLFLDEVAVDITTKESREPAVAAGPTSFQVVWTDRNNAGTGDDIRARNRDSSTTTQRTAYTVSATNLDEHAPDVGGVIDGATNAFLVTWQVDDLGDSDVFARTCSGTAVGSAVVNLTSAKNSTQETRPRVSPSIKSSGDAWLVVWESGPNASGNDQVECVGISTAGAVVGAITTVSNVPGNQTLSADVAGAEAFDPGGGQTGPRDFAVVWEEVSAANGDSEIMGRGMRLQSGAITPRGAPIDLSAGELKAASTAADQRSPAIDFDGVRWVYSYLENDDVFCCTCRIDATATFFEKHVSIVTTPAVEHDVALAAGSHEFAGRHILAWTTDGSPTGVDGSLFSSLAPGGVTLIDNGCGGANEPVLGILPPDSPVGPTVAIVGQQLVFGVAQLHAPILVIGAAANIPLCPNQGGCVLGASPQLVLPFSPSPFPLIGFGVPGDPALIGFAASLQIIDVIPAASASPKCGPPKYSVEFRTSDTLSVVFQ